MKTIFTLLISFLLVSTIAFSQQPFIKHRVTFGTAPRQIALVDLDEDNDLDIVAAYSRDNVLAYYTNDGTGYFNNCKLINNPTETNTGCVVVTDLDNDGKVDILSSGPESISWYKNLGNGNFSTVLMINDSTYKYPRIYAADLDNDSMIDVLYASWTDDIVAWCKNLGNGFFGPQQILNSNADGATSVWSADFDNDGLIDVLSSSENDEKVAWYKNLGNGIFGAELLISNNASWTSLALASDLDNDSLMDVLYYKSPTISWKRNLGNGIFSTESIISDSLAYPYYVLLIDMDNDNDSDLIVPTTMNDTLFWQENMGGGIFGPKQMISNTIDGPKGVCAGDIDGDGHIDVIVGGEKANSISVFHNRGTNTFNLVQTISNATTKVRSVYADDLDNNGLTDILSASIDDDKIAWFKNLGNQKFSQQKVITDSLDEAACDISADLDNDGYPDVISSAMNDTLIWQKNLGNGNFDPPQTISNYADIAFFKAKDLNNDNWIDIIARINMGGTPTLCCFENLGNGVFGTGTFILLPFMPSNFTISDLNNDGYEDLVVYASGHTGCSFNDGTGNFPVFQYFTASYGATAIDVRDMNQDGFKDIVALAGHPLTGYYVKWLPNDGTGNFNTEIFVDSLPDMGYTVFATDINNDSLIDIVTATFEMVHWIENLGSGNFGPLQDIDSVGGWIFSIYPADLDNDQDMDVIVSNYDHSSVTWYENTLNNLVDTITICVGDSAQIFGNWQSQPGDYFDTLQNVQGNDSIIIVKLEHYQTYFPVDTVEICEGETYNFYSQVLTTAGVYHETFQSILGCDSIEELSLVVIPAPVVSISPFAPDSVSIGAGLLALPAATPVGGIYSGTGVTASGFDPLLSGLGQFWISYTYIDTITGCSNQDSTLLKVYDPLGIDELETNKVKLYPNPGTGDFVLTGTNLQSIQVKTLTGELVKEIAIKDRSEVHFNLAGQAKGIYFVHIVNDDAEVRRLLVLM